MKHTLYQIFVFVTLLHILMALQGRFYFGELLEEEHGCTVDICAVVTHFLFSIIHIIFSEERRSGDKYTDVKTFSAAFWFGGGGCS